MRVLHVAQPTTAGVAEVARTLAADQVAHGLDVHVACPIDGMLANAATAAGARHHRWEARRGPGPTVPNETRTLARVIKATKPDVVHLHSSKAGLAGRLAIRGSVPTVFQPHAWSFLAVTGRSRSAALAWERWAARWTHALLAVSEDELRTGREHGVTAPGEVVPNGVDLSRHAPQDRDAARRELGLGGEPLAVCVGRLCEQKGQDLLLGHWQGGRLALVGDGPSAGALRRGASETVTFAGDVADPRPWYAAADVVVVPSRWEGMALVPIEAMAAGRSVVAFGVSGIRESVPPGAGAVVTPGDAATLVGEVVRRLGDRDLAAREGGHGRRHVERHHDAAAQAARVREVYARLAQ